MVDGTVLLAFCEASMRKSTEAEQRLEAQYRENIARLQSEINLRDQQIKSLAQQVEDLQLLTKILERKSRSQT
jgi:cell division protein FtsL